MIEHIKARNWSKTKIQLILLEIDFLNGVLRSFIQDINDFDIKKDIIRGLSLP